MAIVREGSKSVLMVVDVQVGVMASAWDAQHIVSNVAQLVGRARQHGVPVMWVQHADHNLVAGSAAWQWVPELVPEPSERLLHKHFNSAFEQTDLEATLAMWGVTRIVLAGASTNWCIRATAYAALERGYDITLVQDAHTTDTTVLDSGARIEAESVIADLNMAMTWLHYPGRTNGVASAQSVSLSF
jgi:nicotinamidase-related amidase